MKYTHYSDVKISEIIEGGFVCFFTENWAFIEHYGCIVTEEDHHPWSRPSGAKGKCSRCDKPVPTGMYGLFKLYKAGMK